VDRSGRQIPVWADAVTCRLEVIGSEAEHLWDALCRAYNTLGFDLATGGDEVFRALVLARIIEPASKLDSKSCANPSIKVRSSEP